MASSYDTHNDRIQGSGDEGAQMPAFHSSSDSREADVPPKAVWAGVRKGRDGLLGRIETTLGSIS